jgi:hypothetical protein
METKYRLFELKDGNYLTLFHSVNGTRIIPIGQWIKAKQCIAYEGQHGKKYRAAFHVFDSIEIIPTFIKKFHASRTLIVAQVVVRGKCRKKPSNSTITLAPEMMVLNKEPEMIFHI